MNNPSIDEALKKAFNLASFILDDRETAIHTVEEAMARLDVTTAAQDKRLYYKPSISSLIRGDKPGRYRNKVLFGEMHILQRLIYIASEAFEKLKEQSFVANDASEKEMLVHFVKHLVRITTRRNSFYVTLGINRLLYNYTTSETMETFNAVIQDPARVKDDYYYRSRKGVLMQELKKRFGSFLDIVRGPRGEERFVPSQHQSKLAELVNQCLTFFTPWDTYCLVPAGLNPIVDGIPGLSSRERQDENKIEVDRIHAVLHPDCYERLIKMLGYDPPQNRLQVPHFFLSQDNNGSGNGSGGSRRSTSSLSNNELDEIKSHLDDQSARRKSVFAGMLRIVVDGVEQARLAPSRTVSTQFKIEPDAEMIEVRAIVDGDELLLASHLFADRESSNKSKPEVTSIILEGGQKISITVSNDANSADAVVDFAYRETALLRSAVLFLKRPVTSAIDGEHAPRLQWSPARVIPALTLGLVIVALSVLGITQFTRVRNNESAQNVPPTNDKQAKNIGTATAPVVKDAGETPARADSATSLPASPVDNTKGSQESVAVSPSAKTHGTQSADVRGSNGGQSESADERGRGTMASNSASTESGGSSDSSASEGEATRSTKGVAALSLWEVKKIYVEVSGVRSLRDSTRRQLIATLNGSERFIASETKDDADALLKLTITSVKGQSANLVARVVLINARGDVIWSGTNSRGVYTGSYETVAADIVRGLLEAADTSRRR